jgi:hypothetical protein
VDCDFLSYGFQELPGLIFSGRKKELSRLSLCQCSKLGTSLLIPFYWLEVNYMTRPNIKGGLMKSCVPGRRRIEFDEHLVSLYHIPLHAKSSWGKTRP